MAFKSVLLKIKTTAWLKGVLIGTASLAVVGAGGGGYIRYQQKAQEAWMFQGAEEYTAGRITAEKEELDLPVKVAKYSQILMTRQTEGAMLAYQVPQDGFDVEEIEVEVVEETPEIAKKEEAHVAREQSVAQTDTKPQADQMSDVDSKWNGKPGWATISGNKYYYTSDGRRVRGDQTINGRHYYFNDKGALASFCGIDVSKYQTNINWSAVKADGIDFAIIRAGYRGLATGVMVEDPYFKKNIHGAYNAGVDVGLYYFSQAINVEEAKEEAWALIQLARREGVPITYPMVIDIENCGGRADGNSPQMKTQIAAAFASVISANGYRPALYSSKYPLQNGYAGLGAYNIWVAQYADIPRSNYKGSYQIWQYSSTGRVAGISGNVDMNICYVDYKYGRNLETIGTYAITEVPDLTGKTAAEAKAALERVTLKYAATEAYSDTVEAGKVISQDIAPNTQVDEQTTVNVVISKGKEPVTVPNLVGKTKAEAETILAQAGLKAVFVESADTEEPAGTVIQQSLAANVKAYKNDEITITVSSKPDSGSSEEGSSEEENSTEDEGSSEEGV